jgi:hypothetical protein
MEQVDFAPPKVKIPGGFYEAMQRARELLVELAEDAHDGRAVGEGRSLR